MKKSLKLFLKGIAIGFALITAIGGGTMAILLGVYDDIIIAIADFRKNFKKSIGYLAPLVLGMLVGIAAMIYPVTLFLEHAPFVATSLFVGLTLGGLFVFKNIVHKQVNATNIILLIVGILFVAGIGVISWFNSESISNISNYWVNLVVLAIVGFLASTALVAPGISGTLFLLSIGYYLPLINLVKGIFTLSSENIGLDILSLLVFLIALLIGFIVVSKLFKYLLTKWRTPTYFAILGWIIGSIGICYFNGDIKSAYYALDGFETLTFILSIVCLVAGFLISYFLLKYVNKKETEQKEKEAATEIKEINE